MSNNELLDALLADKTPEDLARIRMGIEVDKVSMLLHTFLCPLNHDTGECDYYTEEISTEPSESRKMWHRRTQLMLAGAGIKTAAEVVSLVNHLRSFLAEFAYAPNALLFVQRILPPLIEMATAGPTARPVESASSQGDLSNSASLLLE
jgi:hypothetical protein